MPKLVYLHSNYQYPDLLRQTPGNDGTWKDLKFVTSDVEECDYIVVLNQPTKDLKIKVRAGGRILIIQEPPYQRNNYLISYFKFFDKIIAGFDPKDAPGVINLPAALPWLIDRDYQQLISLEPGQDKKDAVSWVTSNSNVNPGHAPRLVLLEMIRQRNMPVDIFGRGIKAITDKFDGLYPYKYTLAVENYSSENYWTEKISDAYLSWTMPIYYGCLNIEKYFPANSFVKIDINAPEEAIEIINQTVADKLWDKNRDSIREARDLVLNKYQLFPFIHELVHADQAPAKKIISRIPYDPNRRVNPMLKLGKFLRNH